MKTSKSIALGALVGASLLATAPTGARADDGDAPHKKSILDDQPAVRHRLLLVSKRLEATPMFESTINADFRHIIGGGIKLEYHLGDMWSIGVIGVFSTALDTKLTKRIDETLEPNIDDTTREPSKGEFAQHLNKMPLHGAAFVSLTPWYGKVAAFGKAFVNFDFYFQGGFGFGNLTSSCDASVCDDPHPGLNNPAMMITPDDNPNNDAPLNSGFKPGLYLGGGIHVFVNDFIALDLAVRDYAFTDNPSGADFNADLYVDSKDSRFLHHLFAGVGVSVMLPMKAKRTP